MDKSPHTLSIVVPCYNEAAVLPQTARQLQGLLEKMISAGKASQLSQVIFVDDGSTDTTWELIGDLCQQSNLFAGLALSRNFGHQSALLAGLFTASGDAIVSIDADLQDDELAIEEMVDLFIQGCDVVYGVRKQRNTDTFFKRWTARMFYRVMRLLGTETIDNHADFRLMSRRAVSALRGFRETNLFLRGIIPLLGYRRATVLYDRRSRQAGESKYPLRKMLALTFSAITSFSSLPLRLISSTALLSTIVITVISFWVLWVRFFTNKSVPGWASSLLPILFIGAMNMLAVGILGEYVARVFSEVKGRPRFLVAETRNLVQSRRDQMFEVPLTEEL